MSLCASAVAVTESFGRAWTKGGSCFASSREFQGRVTQGQALPLVRYQGTSESSILEPNVRNRFLHLVEVALLDHAIDMMNYGEGYDF